MTCNFLEATNCIKMFEVHLPSYRIHKDQPENVDGLKPKRDALNMV